MSMSMISNLLIFLIAITLIIGLFISISKKIKIWFFLFLVLLIKQIYNFFLPLLDGKNMKVFDLTQGELFTLFNRVMPTFFDFVAIILMVIGLYQISKGTTNNSKAQT